MMSRRQEIENIIIGTLLSSTCGDDYFASCRCCITEDMFADEMNRRIYRIVAEMSAQGCTEINPGSVLELYGDQVADMCYHMCELATEYSFLHKKVQYNERQFLNWCSYGIRPRYTEVTFDDYINRFIQIVFSNAREEEKDRKSRLL